jgi:hypothetical protein
MLTIAGGSETSSVMGLIGNNAAGIGAATVTIAPNLLPGSGVTVRTTARVVKYSL